MTCQQEAATTVEAKARAFAGPLLIALVTIIVLLAELSPRADARIVAAWFPGTGFTRIAQAVAAADARIVAEGSLPGLWLVQSNHSGLTATLRAAGAWILFDPDRIPGCFDSPRSTPA